MTRHLVRPTYLLPLFLFMATACRDSSAPPPPITVTLEASVVAGPTLTVGETSTTLECRVEIAAVATGTGAATWVSGALYFYSGRDRSEAEDTVPLTAETVERYWDAAEIADGDVQEMGLILRAPFPFGIRIEMRYRPTGGGATRTTSATTACGPVAAPGSASPTVSAMSVQPAAGAVERGQPITIQFTAGSPVGILGTTVRLSGACEASVTTPERLELSVTRTVVIPLPEACATDRPLVVTVTVEDGAREEASRNTSMTLTYIDLTAPSLDLSFASQLNPNSLGSAPGTHFHGDSVILRYNAYDVAGLAALVWEVLPSGVKDSIVFGPGTTAASNTIRIPVRATWGTGPVQLRFHARDNAGLLSAPVITAAGATRLYPTIERPSRAKTINGEVDAIAVDDARGVFYLLQAYPEQIAVLSLSTLDIVRLIPLPSRAEDMDLTVSRDSLLVTLPAQVALGVVDLRSETSTVTTIPLPTLDQTVRQMPMRVRTTMAGKALVSVGGDVARASQLLEVDLTTGIQRFRLDAGEQGVVGFGRLERSHDGSAVVLQGGENLLQRYDVPTDRFGVRGSTQSNAPFPSLSADGELFAIATEIFDAGLNVVRRVESTGATTTVLSPDAEYLYGLSWNLGIVRYRVSDGAILDRMINPIGAEFVRVSRDGRYLVTAGPLVNTTSRIGVIELR